MTAEYVPTDAQRSLVESASAFGITQAEIATQLKISEYRLTSNPPLFRITRARPLVERLET